MAKVAAEGPLDLLVLTHVDADHVEGMIMLVNDANVGIDVEEVWFNGGATSAASSPDRTGRSSPI